MRTTFSDRVLYSTHLLFASRSPWLASARSAGALDELQAVIENEFVANLAVQQRLAGVGSQYALLRDLRAVGNNLPRSFAMRDLFAVIKALGIGAGLMYLLDPENGTRRRERLRRKVLEAAVVAGDEADKLLTVASHKLAEQGCQICEQIKHAVTGNGRHHHDEAAASTQPEMAGAMEGAAGAKAEAACPFTNGRLLTGVGGTMLVAYGLRTRSPFSLLATALGVGLIAKAILEESQELAPDDMRRGEPDPTSPSDPPAESRWHVAKP